MHYIHRQTQTESVTDTHTNRLRVVSHRLGSQRTLSPARHPMIVSPLISACQERIREDLYYSAVEAV